MIHMTEKFYFTQGPLCVNSIVEGISNLLDRNLLARKRIFKCTAHVRDRSVTSSILQYCHSMWDSDYEDILTS